MDKLRHIAFIMDGNGRWATSRNLSRSEGHRAGVKTVKEIIKAGIDFNIKYMSFYALSTENFKRPTEEVRLLIGLLREFLDSELNELFQNGAKLKFIGNRELFSKPVRMALDKAEEMTKDNDKICLQIMLGYGSRDEIVRACRRCVEKNLDITEENISNNLDTSGICDPDSMIRTGAEKRLSNFMLYQLSYSELYFSDKLWPDFNRQDLEEAIRNFELRERRYGQVFEK